MHYAFLPQRGLLRLSGEDTTAFLQGLVSNDVTRLSASGIVYAALLSPQGKFLHDFFLIAWEDSVIIDCDRECLPDLLKRLTLYRLRSKVTMEIMPENYGVTALWGDDGKIPEIKSENMALFHDPRFSDLGWRLVGNTTAMDMWCRKHGMKPADDGEYDTMRLEAGVPDGRSDMIFDKSFLLQFGFEDLRGVDFHKGCYVGQEVTARSKHIGEVRKFIYKVQSINGELPAAGTPVLLGDETAGELRSHAGSIGLALMKVEAVEKARHVKMDFSCGDRAIRVELPAWTLDD